MSSRETCDNPCIYLYTRGHGHHRLPLCWKGWTSFPQWNYRVIIAPVFKVKHQQTHTGERGKKQQLSNGVTFSGRWLGPEKKKRRKLTNLGREKCFIIQLILHPCHQVVNILGSRTFDGLFDVSSISPVVFIPKRKMENNCFRIFITTASVKLAKAHKLIQVVTSCWQPPLQQLQTHWPHPQPWHTEISTVTWVERNDKITTEKLTLVRQTWQDSCPLCRNLWWCRTTCWSGWRNRQLRRKKKRIHIRHYGEWIPQVPVGITGFKFPTPPHRPAPAKAANQGQCL